MLRSPPPPSRSLTHTPPPSLRRVALAVERVELRRRRHLPLVVVHLDEHVDARAVVERPLTCRCAGGVQAVAALRKRLGKWLRKGGEGSERYGTAGLVLCAHLRAPRPEAARVARSAPR